MNVLLVAYSCEPGFSSEREVGWKWANLLNEHCNLFVLTRANNENVIKAYLKKNNIECKINFIYFDLPNWAKFWKKGERGMYLYYALWQFFSAIKCRKINKTYNFDITHYLTFGSLLLPQFMFLMPTKYVLGPVGGGENVPIAFISDFSLKGKVSFLFRHAYQKLQLINPLFLLNCYCADKILLRTQESFNFIPRLFHKKCELFLETGVPEELLNYDRIKKKDSEILNIVTVGRFIPTKINLLTLKSIKRFKSIYKKPFRFYIVGDGGERAKLENYCKVHNLTEVIFTGWKDREDVFKIMSESDIYFSTTFKEGGTWAFFEAVAIGLPVVCLKISGPDMIVCDDGGLKTLPTTPEVTVIGLSDNLLKLANDSDLRVKLAAKAKNYLLGNLTWESMTLRTLNIYRGLTR